MAHHTRVRAPGLWTDLSVLLAAEMEAIDVDQYGSIDGDTGGTWAPAAPIIIGGSGLHATGPLTADDLDGTITAFKILYVDPDGKIQVGPGTAGHLCSVTFENFSFAGWASGASAVWATGSAGIVQSGASFTFDAGATFTINSAASFTGAVTFGSLGTTTFAGANSFNGTSATQVLSGGSFQVNAGATLTSASVLGIKLTGTQPAKNVDPGADNIAIATNQAKAWGLLTSDGAGNVACADGMNVANVVSAGNQGWTVTLARGMATTNYAVEATYQIIAGGDNATCWVAKSQVNSTTGFTIRLQKSSTEAYVDVSTAIYAVAFTVMARQ